MVSSILDIEPTERKNNNIIKPQLQLVIPTRVKLSPNQTITGNRYDIVLVCQPDAPDNYSFYDSIAELVESEKNLRMYSPHSDVKRGHTIESSVIFSVREAIPRTRGVLVHLTTITPEIQKMFDATYLNSKPFYYYILMKLNHLVNIQPGLLELTLVIVERLGIRMKEKH